MQHHFDDEAGEYGALVSSESKREAEAAAGALFTGVQQALSDIAREPPRHPLCEVYEPQSQ